MAKKATKKRKPPLPARSWAITSRSSLPVRSSKAPLPDTLETNYMPYAMSVIVSRALPEIDGFKPAHRKLLYTMYGMGLLKGARTKSANIVGSTMHLNPHGDAAIYDTMVRMGRSNESLLVPFVDSKGNFGKAYSRDMAYAAARYTEAKLEPVCEELFRDIDKDTVDFVPNYDGTTTEPTMLPVTFPTILANNTLGIAVGMASNICSFNLVELCNATIALMKDDQADLAPADARAGFCRRRFHPVCCRRDAECAGKKAAAASACAPSGLTIKRTTALTSPAFRRPQRWKPLWIRSWITSSWARSGKSAICEMKPT